MSLKSNSSQFLPYLLILLYLISLKFMVASSANILVYQVVGSHSTRISVWPLVEALADKGHNLTFISPFQPTTAPHPNPNAKIHGYTPRKWAETLGSWEKDTSFYNNRKNNEMAKYWFSFPQVGLQACENLYSDSEFLAWVNSSHFDLIIMETSANECAYGMAYLWKAKVIMYSPTTVPSWYFDIYGIPDETSSVSDLMLHLDLPVGKWNFIERFVNAINPIVWTIMREYWHLPKMEEISKRGLGLADIPSFKEIERNTSLVMITSDFSYEYPRSLPPNVIFVGGLVISDKLKPLEKSVQQFIDRGNNGFVYISFGTVTEFSNFDEVVQQEFIKGLQKFHTIHFIWKSSTEIKYPLPDNILVEKWVSQQSLLASSKIKAFVSHCGMGSMVESVHFGVPVICIPVAFEQDSNAQSMVRKDAGIKLEIIDLKHFQLERALTEILTNDRYRQGMTKLSAVFKDCQVSALDNAVWWTEYVLRHDDVNTILQPPSVQQPWWMRRQIDVWIVAFLIITTTFFSVFWIAKRIVMRLLTTSRVSKAGTKLKIN